MTGPGPMRLPLLLIPLALGVLPTAALAHPVHTSLAEADYHADTHRLEIALRVFADDLEAALSAQAGRKVSLEKTAPAELDTLVQTYLAAHFTVRAPTGGPALPFRWVGRELKDRDNELWLYFETVLPGGLQGARLRHGLLVDQFSDQINTVRLRAGNRQTTLVFFPDRAEKVVLLAP